MSAANREEKSKMLLRYRINSTWLILGSAVVGILLYLVGRPTLGAA